MVRTFDDSKVTSKECLELAVGYVAGEPTRASRRCQGYIYGKRHSKLAKHLANLQPPDLVTQNVSAHARLYVFGHRYMVDSLKKLCLHKLHRDLIEFSVTPGSVSEIVELLRYTYDNTTDETDDQDEDEDCVTADDTEHEVINLTNETEVGNEEVGGIDPDNGDIGDNSDGVDVSRDNTGNMAATSSPAAVLGAQSACSVGDDNELRDLVMAYAVLKAQELMKFACFRNMLQSGGQLVNDFTKGLTRRLAAFESATEA